MSKQKPDIYQKQLLDKMLSLEFPGVEELREQAKDILIEVDDHGDNCGTFDIFPDKSRPQAKVSDMTPVEGRAKDNRKGEVLYLLHVVDGYLNELETVLMEHETLEERVLLDKIEIYTHERAKSWGWIAEEPEHLEASSKELLLMLAKIRSGGYEAADKMRDPNNTITKELEYPNGEEYQLTVQAFYDDRKTKNIRVSGDICDHSNIGERESGAKWWQVWKLVHTSSVEEDFIIAPDGSFIDEEEEDEDAKN